MECAAVDGRGSAVHSHGALYAPLRTPDGELRRPSQVKKYRRAVQPKVGSWPTRRGTREISSVPLRIYRRVSFAWNTLFAEPRRVCTRNVWSYEWTGSRARERITGLRSTDTNIL